MFYCTPHLWKLDLTGNPLTHHAKYRDKVITMVKGIGEYGGRGRVGSGGEVTGVGRMRGGNDQVLITLYVYNHPLFCSVQFTLLQ